MSTIGGNASGPGDVVVNAYINHEKKFAFVEMRSVEGAGNAMALDGIIFEGVSVRVRRPTDYNPSLAATLGPSQQSPYLNLAIVGLTPGATGGTEGPDRIFVGGLPYYFIDAQIREVRLPDLKMSYLTIMTGLTENKRPELMASFLDTVVDDLRIEILTHDWNSIFHAFCKVGRFVVARFLWVLQVVAESVAGTLGKWLALYAYRC